MASAFFLLLFACGAPSETPETPEPPPRPDVVLVTLDTVRADRLGAYGYDDATTPAFDALAARGHRFERAYSPYPLTIPSHATIHTGLYPPQHGVRDNGDRALDPAFQTLAERLGTAGYATGASVAAFVTSRQWGFDQGFSAYLDNVPRATDFWHASRRGEGVVDDALAWYAAQDPDQPTFLWVHLYDAHLPLEPVEPFASAHPDRPYDAEIAYVDAQLGRLVEAFPEDTLFVVAADHGESNGEHGERDHGLYVYDATQRVPLVFSGPGVAPGVSESPVSLIDIVPTVLHLVGLPSDPELPGVVLPDDRSRPLYMESWQLANRFGIAPHRAVVSGAFKLIATPRPELYGWGDLGEVTDLAVSEASTVAALSEELASFGFSPPSRAEDAVSQEAIAELAALGYMVGAVPALSPDALPDPKDRRDLLEGLHLTHLRTASSPEEAIARLLPLVERYPEVPETRIRLAQFYLRKGDAAAAERIISEGLAVDAGPSLRMALVGPLLEQGRAEEALALLLGLRESYDFSPRFRVQLLTTLLATGRASDMVRTAEEYMATYPTDLEVPGVLGVYLARTGEEARAWPLLERALQGERPPPDVGFALGMRAIARGDSAGGKALLETEVRHHPLNLRARKLLAAMARDSGDWTAWERHASRLARQVSGDPLMWRDLAQSLFNLQRYEEARDALDEALRLGPEEPSIVLLDANLLAKEGKRDQGERRFEEARRLLGATEP